MKKLIKILGWVLGIIILLLLAGFLLPSTVSVNRSIDIKAKPEQVYNVLTDLKTYNSWMVWNQRDPQMKQEWGAITRGKGASYKWFSSDSQVGNGELTITEATPGKYVSTAMVFGESPEPNMASWTLEPLNNQTRVKWDMKMDMGMNPAFRWVGLMMKGVMKKDFDSGLAQLKEKIESGQLGALSPSMKLEETKVASMQLLTILDTSQAISDIGPTLQKAYGEMQEIVKSENLQLAGMPMAYFLTESAPYILEAALPVNKSPSKTNGRIKLRTTPDADAVVVRYYGPYEQDSAAYSKIREWLKTSSRKPKGRPYELYVDDPTTKPSMYEVRTDIIQLLD